MAKRYKASGFKETYHDLDKLMSPTEICRVMAEIENKMHILVTVMIGSATAGLGPNGSAYQAYSAKYLVKKRKAGQEYLRLRGINREPSQGMLSIPRFTASHKTTGIKAQNSEMVLKWKGQNHQMTKYAKAHNYGEGRMPEREWMHLDSDAGDEAISQLANLALDQRAAAFQAGTI